MNRDFNSDNKLTNKRYVDDSIGDGSILRYKQTVKNYLKVSVENTVYNLGKYGRIQITEVTVIKFPNWSSEFSQNWKIVWLETIMARLQNSYHHQKVFPTGQSEATSLTPIGTAFIFIETSGALFGHGKPFYL